MDEPICQICGAAVSAEDTVLCAYCKTPHHRRCWDYSGGCSTYGCGCSFLEGEVLPKGRSLSDSSWPIPTANDPDEGLGYLLAMPFLFAQIAFLGQWWWQAIAAVGWFFTPLLTLPLTFLFFHLLLRSSYRAYIETGKKRITLCNSSFDSPVERRSLPFEEILLITVSRDSRGFFPKNLRGSLFGRYAVAAISQSGEETILSTGHETVEEANELGKQTASLLPCPFVAGKEGQELVVKRETNAKEVEVFHEPASSGRKLVVSTLHGIFHVTACVILIPSVALGILLPLIIVPWWILEFLFLHVL